MTRMTVFFTMLCAGGTLAAALFGGEPYEVFDQGANGFVLIGHSLLDDTETLFGEGAGPRGDRCIEESSATLSPEMIFDDAVAVRAYLIWTGAVDPAALEGPTDHTVHLAFSRGDGYTYEADIVAGSAPRYLGDQSDRFLFESVRVTAATATGCSETAAGTPTVAELAYFTYRIEVTGLLDDIVAENRAAPAPLADGAAIAGRYTLSGLDCTDDDRYRCATLMVSNWALLVVYRTGSAPPRDIYLYRGFSFAEGTVEPLLSGLDLPEGGVVRMTMLSAGGDPGDGEERIALLEAPGGQALSLTDDCGDGVELWDSRRTVSTFDQEAGRYCSTSDSLSTYGLDIDDWYLDTTVDGRLLSVLPPGGRSIALSLSPGSDGILTNLFLVSLDRPVSLYDIPERDELRNCPCLPEPPRDIFCGGEPLYILATIENRGETPAAEVYLDARYSPEVFDYIPGTTEIATRFDAAGNGLNWKRFLDGPDGGFPLAAPNLIANTMPPLGSGAEEAGSYLVRFRLTPKKDLPKNSVAKVSATISDRNGAYHANHQVPLSLVPGLCQTTCTEEELQDRCGGRSSGQAQVFDPSPDKETPADDDPVSAAPDEDPWAIRPMNMQFPGCSLALI